MKNKKSAEEIAEMKKQDYVTNKLLLVFTFAFVFLLYIMYLDNSKGSALDFLEFSGKIKTGLWVSAGILGVGVVWLVVEKFIVKRDTKYKLFTGAHVAAIGLFMTVCMYDLYNKASNFPFAFTRLYVFIPLVIALYIIYSAYQRDFFFVSLASAVGGVAIWNMRDYVFGDPTLLLLIAGVAVAAAVAVTVFAQKGVLKLFKSDTKYALIYISYAVIIALLVAAFFFTSIAMYLLYALIAYVVLAGVYYTIKLI